MSAPSRVALITGGSSGIGLALCERFLADGYELVSLDLRPSPIASPKLHQIEVDLTDRIATAEAAHEIARRFEVTTFVHNAGVIRPALVADVQLADLDALVELHLASAIQLLQGVLPAMRAQALRPCRAAVVARRGRAGDAHELLGPPRRERSAWRAPGRSSSPARASPSTSSRPGRSAPAMFHAVVAAGSEKERALAAAVPVQRLGEAADVARAVAFFADPAAGFVTGQVLYVCGGTSVGSLTL